MIISVVNNKGGTGKSTLSYLLGQELLEEDKRVLFVDLDEQYSLSIALGFRAQPGFRKISEQADLLSTMDVSDIDITGYDYVIIDNAPAITERVRWSIKVADKVLVPMLMEKLSVAGLMKIIPLVDKKKLIVVPNMYQKATRLHTEVYGQAKKFMDKEGIQMAEPIARSIKIAEAVSNQGFYRTGLMEEIIK
ncbi:ParA family protein [Exiguobacterium aurantiacum]|uniref:ParA family protein n=1 Tax=Exiguobacterium aurantiacum TaxID=33987 RepID=UPI00384DE9F4